MCVVCAGEARDFVKEFEKVEEHIAKAKGNLAFGLMKPAGTVNIWTLAGVMHLRCCMMFVRCVLHAGSRLPC